MDRTVLYAELVDVQISVIWCVRIQVLAFSVLIFRVGIRNHWNRNKLFYLHAVISLRNDISMFIQEQVDASALFPEKVKLL